jgi:hypothetical protein
MPQGIFPDRATSVMGAPDIDGFRDAQVRLNQAMGTDAIFRTPTAKQWPEGTQIDPDTGEPYDPTIDPIEGSGAFNDQVVRVTVSEPQVQDGSSDVEVNPSGVRRDENPVFIVMEADEPKITAATHVVYLGQTYRITDIQPDGLTTVMRFLVWTEAT